VIGHFHYVVAPGTMFAVFAGIYYWFPKITGRHMNELLGKIHWAGSLFFMNCVFAPMFIQGFKGMSRRMSDGGTTYFGPDAGIGADPGVLGLNKMIFMCAIGLGIAQIPFIINFFSSIFAGKRTTSDNPWQATTLEWATPTPPPHGNFLQEPVAYRGPYEYSVPGAKTDFTPQGDKH
jgi:cytochrome c oxidase subunit 1